MLSSEQSFSRGIEMGKKREDSFSQVFESFAKEEMQHANPQAAIEDRSYLIKAQMMLGCGNAKLVIETLKDVQFDQGYYRHFEFLEQVVKSGNADWVFEKVKDWDFDFGNSAQTNMFISICTEERMSWIKEKVFENASKNAYLFYVPYNKRLFETLLYSKDNRWLLEEIGKRMNFENTKDRLLIEDLLWLVTIGQAKWVTEQLEGKQLDQKSMRASGLMHVLIEHGQVDWVVKHLTPSEFDFENRNENFLVNAIAEHGASAWIQETFAGKVSKRDKKDNVTWNFLQACIPHNSKWVSEQLKEQEFNLSHPLHRKILTKLLEAGEIEWVLEKLDLEEVHGDVFDSCHDLLPALIMHGQAQWVREALKDCDFDLQEAHHLEMASKLVSFGEGSFIKEKIFDQLDAAKEEHQYLLDIFSYEQEGYYPAFSEKDISTIKQHETERINHLRNHLIADVELSFSFFTSSKKEKCVEGIKQTIKALPDVALQFLDLTKKKHGWFSKEMLRAIDALGGQKKKFVLEIQKTGSDLRIYGERIDLEGGRQDLRVTFVNDIPTLAAQTWQEAKEAGIPVSPILGTKEAPKGKKDNTRVYSRYCGTSVYYFLSPKLPKRFVTLTNYSVERLKQEVVKAGIEHGHPHFGNITVEFIRKDYLEQSGQTVNDIPYHLHEFTFDVAEYLEHPDQWELVMRMIDWDAAQSSSSGS